MQLVALIEKQEAEDEAFEGRMLLLRPKLTTAFREFLAHPVAPTPIVLCALPMVR